MFSQVATGILLDPCYSAGNAYLLPTYHGPNDPVGFTIFIPSTVGTLNPYPEYKYYWVKQSVTGDAFVVDVILTDDTTTFPGYTLVDKSAQNWGFIGPLPAGTYTILGTVNVYDPATGTIHPECDPATFGPAQRVTELIVWALDDPYFQGLRAVEAPVVEFYNASLDHYFITMNPAEIVALDQNSLALPGWHRTGYRFFAYVPGNFFNARGESQTNVVRYYGLSSAGINSHFFTLNAAEAASLSNAWVLENGDAFEIWEPLHATGVCPANTFPVYRLWNGRTDSNHRYTIDPSVRLDMIAKGWISEGYGPNGVVICSPAV
jgi:hypothetical protein